MRRGANSGGGQIQSAKRRAGGTCRKAAEITARMDRDPGEIYHKLTREFGEPVYDRVEASATPEQKAMLERLSAHPSAG